MKVRRARSSDLDAIVALEEQFPGDRMSRRSVRRLLRSPTAIVLVAEGHVVAGALVLLTRRNARVARIYSIAVDPALRGRGIGASLVTAAERTARGRHCRSMSLEVRSDNAGARAMYRKLGYAEVAALPRYYDDGTGGVRLRRML